MAPNDEGNQMERKDVHPAPVHAQMSPPARPPPSPANPFNHMDTSALTQYPNPFYSLQSGYNLVIYIVKNFLGFDPGIIVNLSIFFAGMSTVGRYATNYLYHYVKKFITASTRIQEDEPLLYHDVLRFMSEKWLKNRVFQDVKASTYGYVAIGGEAVTDDKSEASETSDSEDEDEIPEYNGRIHYRNFKKRSPVKFQPYELSRLFYYKGNFFFFRHSLRFIQTMHHPLAQRQSGELTLECLGRSLEPIRRFLEDAQEYCDRRLTQTTSIFRANAANWILIGRRPSRDINTVIFEKGKKRRLLRDIHEYISPTTKKWYANHGIPYRRGYLFSGPPGTGKTSLTAALAGVFGLDIYVLSLLDPMINEDALVRLFSSVGPRSIVLLEDIDVAGLTSKRSRVKMPQGVAQFGSPPTSAVGPPPPGMFTNPGMAPPPRAPTPPAGVSLSGLLNAIDGVSSSEGHILIMTTNHPEHLDAALLRPGRVDMHVHFTLPHRQEITEMFLSMYKDISKAKKRTGVVENDADTDAAETDTNDSSASVGEDSSKTTVATKAKIQHPETAAANEQERNQATTEKSGAEANGTLEPTAANGAVKESRSAAKPPPPSKKELQELAAKFGDSLPEGKLSLAAIQGLLLTHKKDPRLAVAVAREWAEETLRQVEEGEREDDEDEEGAYDEGKGHGPEHIEVG